jgi:hypothetical protein
VCPAGSTSSSPISKRTVAPGSRKRLDAKAKLRFITILQASFDGEKSQPSDEELDRVVKRINGGGDRLAWV